MGLTGVETAHLHSTRTSCIRDNPKLRERAMPRNGTEIADPCAGGSGQGDDLKAPGDEARAKALSAFADERQGTMPSRAFDPETVKLIGTAYDAAWREIEAAAAQPLSAAQKAKASAELTKHLLAAADKGERDPAKLKLLSLEAMRQK
jgi:hypothetical protein